MTEAGVAPPGWGAAPGAPWGGALGLGAGVMWGQALERGGNAAFSDSSAFLRSSRETLAPSLRARSPAQRGRFPCGDVVGSGGTPGHWGFGDRLPPAPHPPSWQGCPRSQPLRRSGLGGTGSSPAGRGRPSRRLGGTCLHWSGLVLPGGGGSGVGAGAGSPRAAFLQLPAALLPGVLGRWGSCGVSGTPTTTTTTPPQGRKGLLWVLREAPGAGLGVGLGLSGFSQRRRGVRQGAQAGVSQMQPRGRLGRPLTSGGPQEARGAPRGLSEPLLCWGGGNGMERGRWWCWDQEGGALCAPCLWERCEQTPRPGGHRGAGEVSVAKQGQRWPMAGGSVQGLELLAPCAPS